MRKANTKPPFVLPDEELDPAIARYETMPIEQVNAELMETGVDPHETIAAVKALVTEVLRTRNRRSLHNKAILVFVADTLLGTVPSVRSWCTSVAA